MQVSSNSHILSEIQRVTQSSSDTNKADDVSREQENQPSKAEKSSIAAKFTPDILTSEVNAALLKAQENLSQPRKVEPETRDDEQADETGKSASTAVEDFLEYMNKTPEERMFDAMLAEEGLTREEFEALPLEERMKIEEKIQQKIRERVGGDTPTTQTQNT